MPHRSAPHIPILRYATATDPGRKRLANEDAAHHDARLSMFVVCDGVGGRPSGEAASNLVAFGMPHLVLKYLQEMIPVDFHIDTPGEVLVKAAVAMHETLKAQATASKALEGMACTVVAAQFDVDRLHVGSVGDSRAYVLRQGTLHQITDDDSVLASQLKGKLAEANQRYDKNQRLLTQILGMKADISPHAKRISLKPHDRILLCTDGLTDPLEDDAIATILKQTADSGETVQKLVDAANEAGGPDNITVTVVDYDGVRPVTDADKHPPAGMPERPLKGEAEQAMALLDALIYDMGWLDATTTKLRADPHIDLFDIIEAELGPAWGGLPTERDADPVIDRFHSVAMGDQSMWRQRYDQRIRVLEPVVEQLADFQVRLSPFLPAQHTSHILAKLWNGWRNVEQRFSNACEHRPISLSASNRAYLVRHMLDSARTINGLIATLPGFGAAVKKPAMPPAPHAGDSSSSASGELPPYTD